MSTTDQAALSSIQTYMLEPANLGVSWASGFWTAAEVIGYLDERQKRFIMETGLVAKTGTAPLAANVLRTTLPADCIELRFLAFQSQSGDFYDIPRADPLQADLYRADWTYDSKEIPDGYSTSETPSLEVELHPSSSLAGVLHYLYLYVSTTLTGAGALFTVPDDFVPCIIWGVIADMLKKIGRATALDRAEIAESRYTMGVEITKLILSGWA